MNGDNEIINIEPFDVVIEWKPKQILEYLAEHNATIFENYSIAERNAIYSRCVDSMYNDSKETPNSHRRQIWLNNHAEITRVIHKTLTEKRRMPMVGELVDETSLSRVTIGKHLKHFERDEYLSYHRNKWKLAEERVFTDLYLEIYADYKKPADRNRARSLFLKYSERFTNTAKPAENGTKNFIQVNNVYITPETIKELPVEKQQMIENIILESNVVKRVG